MRMFIFTVALIAAAGQAEAEGATVNKFLNYYDTADASTKMWIERTFGSAEDALGWANTELASRGEKKLYCQPDNLAITDNQAFSMFRRDVEENKDLGNMKAGAKFGILFFALKNTFPCKD